ncbi:Phage tail-collar fibre protein [Pseudomonas sp. NFACC09-4]|uniref:phage tail-collar fiber domain-containing protein n=1 Tax=Pseudomonas sp. NFACC09-4 TaxID=1566237 RepID=UPI000908CC39|nr:phage tail protein [Pseudomonas sp. NFACC09-4]SFW61395.1 Phage tail-collar fibre protein [Pseudomonas sp. NFACC09-4]
MINETSQFFAILTNVGAAKQANADALGIPWKISEMGVGDANGTDPIPSPSQTALINERRRRPLNQLFIDPANPAVLIAEQVIPDDVGGFWIREIGLYDADGDLVAVANCAPSYKPLLPQGSGRTQVVRVNFIVGSAGNITLKIDPSVVLATREFVDKRIVEELCRLDARQSVRVATTAPIVLSGLLSIDGVQLVAGDRVLVKNQASSAQNGIYNAAASTWARAEDADSSVEVTPGLFVPVEDGAVNGDSLWHLVTNAPITLGTTGLTFEMLAGRSGVAAGTYRSVTVDKYGRVTAGANSTVPVAEGGTGANAGPAALVNLGAAPIVSPAFTGTPTAPTAALGTNTAQLATTAFVRAALASLVDSSPGALDTLNELAAALGNDPNFAATMTNALAGKLNIAVPSLPNFNNAEAGPFMGAAAAAIGSPDTSQGAIWGFTYLDAAKSQTRVQLAMHTGTGGLYVRSYNGTAWGVWRDFTPPSDAKVARAWVDFNGTGAVAIRSSHNVSSITDNGTGDYTVNLATPMPNGNYAAITNGSNGDLAATGINCTKAYSRTVSSFKVGTTNTASGNTDFLHVDAVVFSS